MRYMPTEQVELEDNPTWGSGGNTVDGGIAGTAGGTVVAPSKGATWKRHGWRELGRAARYGTKGRSGMCDLEHVGDLGDASTIAPDTARSGMTTATTRGHGAEGGAGAMATTATLSVAGKLPEGVRKDEGEGEEDRRGIGYFMTKHMMAETIEQLRVRCPLPGT